MTIIDSAIYRQVTQALKQWGLSWRQQWRQDNPGFTTYEKAPNDFVTTWDLANHELVRQQIQQWIPGSTLVSEETEASQTEPVGVRWVLDPIDGTANLMHRHPHFAVSLALILDEQTVGGWVYDILRNELFFARQNHGAWLNGHRITVSSVDILSRALIGIGTPVQKDDAHPLWPIYQRLFNEVQDVRRSGSAALDLAWTACGRLDGYVEKPLHVWDWAAGSLLVREAGGQTSTWAGLPLSLSASRQSILASNGRLSSDLRQLLTNRQAVSSSKATAMGF